jgi:hypothetical protein
MATLPENRSATGSAMIASAAKAGVAATRAATAAVPSNPTDNLFTTNLPVIVRCATNYRKARVRKTNSAFRCHFWRRFPARLLRIHHTHRCDVSERRDATLHGSRDILEALLASLAVTGKARNAETTSPKVLSPLNSLVQSGF